jgi:hypothetical protein
LPLQIAVANKPPQIVVGLSRDLDEKLTAAHLQTLQAVKAYVDRRDSLEEILKALNQERLEVVYFYCHGGSDDRDGPYLEVGKAEPIWPPDVTAWGTTWNETHWKETSPLIFINGCRTAALTPDVLVNFVDNFVGVYAAGVIGTEVIVHQQLANEVALEVLTRIALRNNVGRSISEMRMHLLRKGNLLGLAYTPYCSASLALSAPASA